MENDPDNPSKERGKEPTVSKIEREVNWSLGVSLVSLVVSVLSIFVAAYYQYWRYDPELTLTPYIPKSGAVVTTSPPLYPIDLIYSDGGNKSVLVESVLIAGISYSHYAGPGVCSDPYVINQIVGFRIEKSPPGAEQFYGEFFFNLIQVGVDSFVVDAGKFVNIKTAFYMSANTGKNYGSYCVDSEFLLPNGREIEAICPLLDASPQGHDWRKAINRVNNFPQRLLPTKYCTTIYLNGPDAFKVT